MQVIQSNGYQQYGYTQVNLGPIIAHINITWINHVIHVTYVGHTKL